MAEKNNNYILIGMPGSGKSTIGVLLAKALGYDFVDTDLVIQQKGGGLLKEIIARIGNDGFKQLEELELNYKKDLEDNKSKISQQIEKQLDSLLKSAFSLADEHVFSEEELWNIIHTNIDKHQSKSNQKSKKKGKK